MKRLLASSFLAVPLLAAPVFAADDITVMTRNMYFGADLTPALLATTPPELILAATHIFGVVNASDVVNRVDRMAREIARAKPDLVGLQEVAIWRTQLPADFAPIPNATTVVAYDFLELLLDDLAARGEHYVVVATHVTNDLEAPTLCPNSVPFTCFVDVRLTDREVILARAGGKLKLSNVQEGTFLTQVAFTVPGPAGPTTYTEKRGWLSVDVKQDGDRFRFVSTHLLPEGFFDPVQVAQGQEILAGPANTPQPVILVCDCNSRADDTGTTTYMNLIAAGFADAWVERHPGQPGLTCCQAEDLRNVVDLVLIRGRAEVEDARRTGATEAAKTTDGLWPSDHAGVVATIDLRR